MLKNISIKHRLSMLLFFIISTILLLTIWQNSQLSQIDQSFKLYKESAVQGETNILQISRDMNYCSRLTRSIMLGDNYDKNYKKLLQRIDDIKSHFIHLKSSISLLESQQQNTLSNAIQQSETDTMAFLNDSLRRMNELGETNRSQEIRNSAWKDYKATASPVANKARASFKELIKLEVQLKEETIARAATAISHTKSYTNIVMLLFILVVTVLTTMLTYSVSKNLNAAVEAMKGVAEGEADLTKRLEVLGKDEIGALAGYFNVFLDKLQEVVSKVKDNVNTINTASVDFSDVAGQMSASSEETQGRAQTVAAAAKEMSANMNSVAAASEETSVNVNMVASAAEEMSATIAEIASNTEKTSAITDTAVTQSQKASTQIHELGSAALEVGKVTESISEISAQTNLLALNATIEAARAGEAGKGFAVVANEIKELAKQTSEATNEIKEKIDKIQNASKGAVADITEITKIIGEVSEMVSIVAGTVEEQASATQEISDNVSQASLGIQEVNENVAQASAVTEEVASDIAEVGQVAQELNSNSNQVTGTANDLKELSGKLSEIVSQFKV